MKQTKHIGIYLSNVTNKKKLIEEIQKNSLLYNHIELSNKKGFLHSPITIDQLIEEEVKHDKIIIHSEQNNCLQNMSSGQQRTALLKHIVNNEPDFIILDDIFSNIDQQAQSELIELTENIKHKTSLIQLFFRKNDILPCIDTIFTIDFQYNIKDTYNYESFNNTTFGSTHERVTLPKQYIQKTWEFNPLVSLKDVCSHYLDKKVLININWEIHQGEFWQLCGPNGAGKSTLLSLITGDNPRSYTQNITLFGMRKGSGETIWDIKKHIGYFTPAILQQFTRNESVENMIISGMFDSIGLYTKPSDIQRDLAKSWIKLLGKSFENKSFQDLSIGQKRMVMVARAMVKHPPLLILDEPTIELDDENAELFINMINAIAFEKKVAIIYVSHRKEPNLKPEKTFRLTPHEDAYTGQIE